MADVKNGQEDLPDNSGSRVPVTPDGVAFLLHVQRACHTAADRIDNVSRNVTALQTDVNELKEQFRELKEDVDALKNDVFHCLYPRRYIRVIKVKVSKYAFRRRRARRRGPN